MRLATVDQSRKIDELAQSQYGLSDEILMEAAGALAAREIELSYIPELHRGTIGIVCGPGNNGADGLVLARHLHSIGHGRGDKNLTIFLAAPPNKRSELFQLQLIRCEKLGIRIISLIDSLESRNPALKEFSGSLKNMSLIVDAIFGIGLRSEVLSPYYEVIEAINEVSIPVVSLDVPSGLDADRGGVSGRKRNDDKKGIAVKASQTITFGCAKPGFFVSDGPSFVGRLRVLPIGFPFELRKEIAKTHFAFTNQMLKKALPRRGAATNKSNHGHAMIFAGRAGYWGAAALASGSAYRVGAGYVTLASFNDASKILKDSPETLTALISDEKIWKDRKWTAVGVGPGLGVSDETYQLLKRLISENIEKVVIDADAITVIAEKKLYPLPKSWVVTPHAGELSRLLGVPAKEIESDRFNKALEASRLLGCQVLLKGYRTVHARYINDEPRVSVILSGNSALAKAGTGDVLTGMITGLMAQGCSTSLAAAAGAFIHGKMADEWVSFGHDRRALTASDLREILPSVMSRLVHG